MTLLQRRAPASAAPQVSAGLAALTLGALALVVAIGVVVFLGTMPASGSVERLVAFWPGRLGLAQIDNRRSAPTGLQNQACAAAIKRAKISRDLPPDEAIAASTAMLRICNAH